MVSKKAQRFINMKIRKNILEGRSKKQSIAIALSQARKRGYRIASFKKK